MMEVSLRDPATEVINEANRALVINNLGAIRPVIEFPASTIGSRIFKFHSRWYNLFPWLEYSEEKDAAFCFFSRWFGIELDSLLETFKLSKNRKLPL